MGFHSLLFTGTNTISFTALQERIKNQKRTYFATFPIYLGHKRRNRQETGASREN